MELKYRVKEVQKKDGTLVKVVEWFVEIDLNGKKVPYKLDLDYSQSEFLQALVL